MVYVFGGGSATELDHIVSFDPASGAVHTVGSLPHAQSDVAVTESGGTAYVVGGYDGTNWFNTILAWRPGSPVRVAGQLPVGLRYAAATAVGGRILIIGGSTPTSASDAIYSFDPATGQVRTLGKLPQPITHASAATLGSFAYLVGGRGNNLGTQTATVWSIDPAQWRRSRSPDGCPSRCRIRPRVPINGTIVVAGGLAPTTTVAGVGQLVPPLRLALRAARLDGSDVVGHGLLLRGAQLVRDRHLAHELEHLGARHLHPEQIAALLVAAMDDR